MLEDVETPLSHLVTGDEPDLDDERAKELIAAGKARPAGPSVPTPARAKKAK